MATIKTEVTVKKKYNAYTMNAAAIILYIMNCLTAKFIHAHITWFYAR
jgi:hypothetical protein